MKDYTWLFDKVDICPDNNPPYKLKITLFPKEGDPVIYYRSLEEMQQVMEIIRCGGKITDETFNLFVRCALGEWEQIDL